MLFTPIFDDELYHWSDVITIYSSQDIKATSTLIWLSGMLVPCLKPMFPHIAPKCFLEMTLAIIKQHTLFINFGPISEKVWYLHSQVMLSLVIPRYG